MYSGNSIRLRIDRVARVLRTLDKERNVRGMIFSALKDLATKDPEKTKEILHMLKAKAEALTPEDRQRLYGTLNDLKSKAMNLTDEQRSKIADAIRKSDGT
jgi:hypothetical protein